MRNYSQLTLEKRYGIYSLLKTGHTQSKIAEVIGVHKSTISRELIRNRGGRGYRYKQTHGLALSRRQGKSPPRIDVGLWSFLETLIRKESFGLGIQSGKNDNKNESSRFHFSLMFRIDILN